MRLGDLVVDELYLAPENEIVRYLGKTEFGRFKFEIVERKGVPPQYLTYGYYSELHVSKLRSFK